MVKKILLSVIGFFVLAVMVLIVLIKLDSFPSQYNEVPVSVFGEEHDDPYFKYNSGTDEKNEAKKIFKDLSIKLKGWIEKGYTNGGEIFIAKDSVVLHHSSAGWKDIEDGEKHELNTICRIRSMTKPFIGTLILQFVENKKLKLSDKAGQYIKSLSKTCTSNITIKDLLQHTSGFNQQSILGLNNLKSGIDSIANKCVDFKTGEKFTYSDVNTAILALVLEEVSGKSIETLLKQQIFIPLRLENTHTQIKDSFRNNLSSTHIDDPLIGLKKYWDNNEENFVSYFRASGGIFSTARDYAVFCHLWIKEGKFMNQEILQKETIDSALLANKLSISAKKNYYGYGNHLQIFEKKESEFGLIYGHSGSDGTLALIIPKYDLIICFFTQTRNNKALKLFYQTIIQKMKKIKKL
ncbi:serine hydrolase domain-containing protein [Flavivirga eckloniae]|uniref:Beta-lactamase-related domain-containing protein n=1 Tax=Flavivirga eckloniae TaxID=1803846 RepID=A0A2K9PMN9_9FLAO|nr:serine hydrolase domain-containing protein [Flavivirga eckloniae]AUP78322.1 hypothetical protein C1H87_06180 [Flavivirga eckloniae]